MRAFLSKYKYEVLLFGLLQHLYIGLFLRDFDMYQKVYWPLNMVVLGIACTGLFTGKSKRKIFLKNIILVLVIFIPILFTLLDNNVLIMRLINLLYVLFFVFVFYEIMAFLVKPSHIGMDVLSASACGFLLMIEVFVFMLQYMYYTNPNCMTMEVHDNAAEIYMDMVYFATVSLTTIGYGDILPNSHHTKLFVSVMGLAANFYSVILVGILVGKFSSVLDIGIKKK